MSAAPAALFLGCPVWACADWRGSLFPAHVQSAELLAHYAQCFNAVEGNSSFYALPSARHIAQWRAATSDDFRFCFKFPRRISHELQLRHAAPETQEFLQRIAPLGARLGPIMLQLGPKFSPAYLPDLQRYLDTLSAEFHYAVEVRHPEFFLSADAEAALDELLVERHINRCHFDAQALHRAPAYDVSTKQAQARKPNPARRAQRTASAPILRLIGPNDGADMQAELRFWAMTVAAWLRDVPAAYCFTHTPDDQFAPLLAKRLHAALREQGAQIADLPKAVREFAAPKSAQLSLF
jgi:uncharacterized protein YecE (DUF72 family)